MREINLSVVIPSRNGLSILKEFLPAILREANSADGEVIVVDDCSTDDTCSEIPILFPKVILIKREIDPGFCHAVNLGMLNAKGDYLLLLNNDTIPGVNSFTNLVLELEQSEKNVAVAVPTIPRPDKSDDSLFEWKLIKGLAVTGESISGEEYPSGACSLWKREAWNQLGGLDTSYAPIYWEDTDMGVRMHKAGYLMKHCPDITVKHMHAATMGSSLSSETLRERNRFIFMARNCTSPAEKLSRLFWIPIHLLSARLRGNSAFTQGYKDYLKWKGGGKS